MKKLMFVAAVAATAALWADGLESANTVGYEQPTFRQGSTLFTPMFTDVGVDQIDIQTIKPIGDDVDGDGAINLQTLAADGTQGDVFLAWYDDGTDSGWYDSNDDTPSVMLSKGDAFWIDFPNATTKLNIAGEVKNAALDYPLVQGATAVGNPYPVAINVQTIIPVGDDVDGDGAINLQTLAADGTQGDVFLAWYDDGTDSGWYDANDDTPATMIQPGEGLWVDSPNSTTSLRFPGFSL